jgi:hypothetical protein
VTRLEFTVPGRPCSKNATYERRGGKGRGLRLSDAAQDFWTRVQFAAIGAIGHERCQFTRNVAIVVTSHFARDADSGASLALVKDALQRIAYPNDKCVVFEASWKGTPDPKHPRTEVRIWELDVSAMMVHVPIPSDCAIDYGERTKVSRAAALATRQKSDRFEACARLLCSSKRDFRPADPWQDGHEPTKIPEGF